MGGGKQRIERGAVALALAALIFESGCASLISGSSQRVYLHSEPDDARVVIDGVQVVHAGQSIDLERGKSHQLRFEHEGYQPRQVMLETSMNPWIWGNFVLLPLFFVGIFVDAVSGAVVKFDRDQIEVVLEPVASPPPIAKAEPPPPPVIPPKIEPTEPSDAKPVAALVQQKWVVAVMDMLASADDAASPRVRAALTDQMRVFLGARRIRVVDRGAQENALRSLLEDERAKSYDRCVDEACQIPLGKALAASHIVRSGLARFGATCTANGELIDLKTEVTIAAASTRSDCSEEGLLDATERLADDLIKGSR